MARFLWPRSGTTVLQQALNGHSKIVIPPETKYFNCFYGKSQKQQVEQVMRVRDVVTVVGTVLAFLAVADWKYHDPQQLTWLRLDSNFHLGTEYDEIARAIRSGRGFSDPFKVESGPTAWMAPVLPYVLAGLYWVFGDNRETVVELVLLIKALVLVLTGLLVVREGRRIGRVWLAYLGSHRRFRDAHFHQMFQRTHDIWLVLLVVDLTWMGIVRLWVQPKGISAAVVWGWFGGLTALCSPIAGATWAVVTALRWRPRGRGSLQLSGQWLGMQTAGNRRVMFDCRHFTLDVAKSPSAGEVGADQIELRL